MSKKNGGTPRFLANHQAFVRNQRPRKGQEHIEAGQMLKTPAGAKAPKRYK